ncbi:hypothetical protein BVC80_1501g5 [Macleaya cordata]|uniref:UBZ4-type domain-containing protein n=1 Tax=Macleaya cordata TaxID=56857 RepID=A0A200Q0Z1_MACCD|nr:hypothetical protein BVC80_1501g5 [Macleaya cordata]
MLSIENNPDPLCSYKISGLKNDERASTTVALEEADLLKSGLADDNHLPTFSIRDYAFTARRKGIEKNWPFPQEYLQLCLKHGIRDLLPPFEPPDSVRNRTLGKNIESAELVCVDGKKSSVVEVNSLEDENVGLDGESHRSESVDQSVLGCLDQTRSPVQEQKKLAAGPSGTDLCILSVIPDLDEIVEEVSPTIATNNVQSEREKISTSRLPCSGEVGTASSKGLIELEVPGAPQKNESTIESPSKKCKLIEKSGIVSGPSRTEDIVSNTTTISEPMASKVCPVCKTFLSSSNTTLNAHIDQCLAAESTSKLTGNFQLSKHKIKPRKKRLMVDIYETAPRCTLEELDRRNGTNWAAGSSLSTADSEVCAEGKRQRLSQTYFDDTGDESAVYFDSNGRKVRILSKLDDASVPRPGEDLKPRKHINENKERNTCLTGKVKRLGSKDSKHLKFKPQNKKVCSLKPDGTEICDAPEGNDGLDENCEKEDSLPKLSKAHDQINSGELRQWVCSKRTGLSKKLNGKDARRGLGLMTRDPLIESNQSNLSNSSMETSFVQKLPNPSENPDPSQKTDKGERFLKPPESHLNRLNDGTASSTHVGCNLRFPRSSQNHASSPRSKRVEIQSASLAENSDNLPKRTVNPSEICNPVSPQGKMFSTSRKNVLVGGTSSPKSKSDGVGKNSTLRKSRKHRSMIKTSEQVRTVPSDVDEQYDWMHNSTEEDSGSLDQSRGGHKSNRPNKFIRREEMAIGRSDVLVSEQGRETSRTLGRKESKALGGLESGFKTSSVGSHVGAHSSNSFPAKSNGIEFAAEEVPLNGEDIIMEPCTEKASRGPCIRSRETSISETHRPATPSNTRSNCFQSIEEHVRPVSGTEAWRGSSEKRFSDGQESQLSKDISDIIQRIHTSSDVDCRVGGNSFSEIEHTQCGSEPISIPGPPGYFLPPSPGDISSEIHVENSSLTSNRLPSSQDRSLLVDRDSSGSPVSATSTISHLHTSRSDSNYVEPKSFVGPSAVLEKFVPCFSSDGNTKPLVGGDINTFSCAPNIENAERINLDMENLKATKKSLAEGSLKISDDQTCCCSWKERIPSDDSLMYQAFQLLRQHNMAPSVPPSMGMQRAYNPKIRPEVFASSSGSPSSKMNENVIPMLDSSRDSVSLKTSSDAALKFSGHGDFSSASSSAQAHNTQSTSNPVLRLMGKNLMVVNKEEDSSSELKEAPPVAPDSKCPMLQRFSSGNMTTEDYSSLYRMASDGSVIFNHDRYDEPMNRFDVDLSDSSGNHRLSKIHHTNLHPPAGNHYNNHHMGGFGSLPQHGSKDTIDHLQTVHGSLVDRSNCVFRYNVERTRAAPQQNQNPASAAPNSIREVIVIDDSPENEADLSRKYSQESMRKQLSPVAVGSLPSPHLDPNLRQVNPFYSYPSQNSFSLRETPVGTYSVLCPRGTGSPAKQGDNSNGLLHSSIGPLYRRPIL